MGCSRLPIVIGSPKLLIYILYTYIYIYKYIYVYVYIYMYICRAALSGTQYYIEYPSLPTTTTPRAPKPSAPPRPRPVFLSLYRFFGAEQTHVERPLDPLFFFCCFLRAHEPLLRHPCSVAALTCDNGGGSIFFLLQNGSRFISFGQNHCSDWKFLIRYILKIKLACDIRYLWFSTFY
jgi:hypothetical protein